jgi:hypothetical protein
MDSQFKMPSNRHSWSSLREGTFVQPTSIGGIDINYAKLADYRTHGFELNPCSDGRLVGMLQVYNKTLPPQNNSRHQKWKCSETPNIEADARAKLLIYLLEKELIPALLVQTT